MFSFFQGRLATCFDHAETQIFKAIDQATGKVYGFACWTLETGDEAAPTPTGRMMQQLSPYVNAEFVLGVGAEIEQLREHMKGEVHYYTLFRFLQTIARGPARGPAKPTTSSLNIDLTAFAVETEFQSQGIGSQLLKHCLRLADAAKLASWLISFPGSHTLYLRARFEDVDHRDIDLNAWDKNKLRGYGVYRQYAMVQVGTAVQNP